jgi:predicted nucleic acid-binding protein
MRIILDTNEYVFAFGRKRDPTSLRIVDTIVDSEGDFELYLLRTIADEVQSNLAPEACSEFYSTVLAITSIDEDWLVPEELAESYRSMGLKEADAEIAAYAQHVAADYLVSENRHFLSRREDLPFKVVTAEEFLELLGKGDQ